VEEEEEEEEDDYDFRDPVVVLPALEALRMDTKVTAHASSMEGVQYGAFPV
jgi:hypothetical protein